MDDPVADIEGVVRQLTQTPPSVQRSAIITYFTPDAQFTHPFCRTGSFDGSRFLIRAIYRWYKIMSPSIDLTVNSIAYDSKTLTLYVDISQSFRIFVIPFYRASVNLTSVLKLVKGSNGRYYISSQNDLYQVNEFIKFVAGPIGAFFVLAWQFAAALVCLVAAAMFWPISWAEEHGSEVRQEARDDVARIERRMKNTFIDVSENSQLVTASAIGNQRSRHDDGFYT